LSDKEGSGWFPKQPTKHTTKGGNSYEVKEPTPSPPHTPPSQPSHPRAPKHGNWGEIHAKKDWKQCYRNDCKAHKRGKIEAGYYPKKGRKEPLSRTDEITRKARATVRSRLAGEGSEKTMDDIVSLQRINDELMRERDQLRATIEQQQRTLEIANITLETTRRSLKEAEARDRATRREIRHLARRIQEEAR
jgi:hypothetical protein